MTNLALIGMLVVLWLSSCNKKESATTNPVQNDPVETTDAPAETQGNARPQVNISKDEVNTGGCLNLTKLYDRLKDIQFTYPAVSVTTGFENLNGEASPNFNKFLSSSAFYYKSGMATDLVPLNKTIQSDCLSLKMESASGIQLKYNIVESSDSQLNLELTNDFDDSVLGYQKENLFNRFQPVAMTIVLVSETALHIDKKIRMFHPLCKKNKKGFEAHVAEDFVWAKTEAELPQSHSVEKKFLVHVLSALKDPPFVDPDQPMPLLKMKEIMSSPILDEIKFCD